MNYIVFYTKGASPAVKEFKTKKAALAFADKHERKNNAEYSDDWSDCVVQGKIVQTYRNWYARHISK